MTKSMATLQTLFRHEEFVAEVEFARIHASIGVA